MIRFRLYASPIPFSIHQTGGKLRVEVQDVPADAEIVVHEHDPVAHDAPGFVKRLVISWVKFLKLSRSIRLWQR